MLGCRSVARLLRACGVVPPLSWRTFPPRAGETRTQILWMDVPIAQRNACAPLRPGHTPLASLAPISRSDRAWGLFGLDVGDG